MRAALIFLFVCTMCVVVPHLTCGQKISDSPEDGCDVPGLGYLKKGEGGTEKGCISVTCVEKGKLVRIGCGLVGLAGNCHFSEDVTKKYPDCCPKVICPDRTRNN